jgi:serine/threonine protein kinase
MEMLQGRSLEALVTARGRLGREDTIGLGLQLCSALSAVHRAGVVHRDVKPMNMVVVRDAAGTEQVKLVDFGIVRAPTTDERLTGIGTIIGTPAYMSPEQLMGLEDLDGAADVYSAGVTLFECLSGEVPYPGSYPAVLTKVSSPSRAPSVRDLAPDVDPGLAAVVDRAIAKSRIERFGSAEEMAEALRSLPGASSRTTLLGPSPAAGAPTVEQRRQWRRAAYNTPVRIVLPDGVIDGRSDDVSEGGMLVIAREGCEPGQRVGLRFALPMEGKVASVEANVRWVRRPGAQCALGLEFVLPPAHVRSSIARYVALMSESASVRPGSAT